VPLVHENFETKGFNEEGADLAMGQKSVFNDLHEP